jgi:2-dehydro-3-deoxygluconokinase
MAELVTFGETMLRLSPPRGERLARADSLDVHVGGAESNVAVAAAALGVDAAWLSALPDSQLGERVTHALRGEDVEPLVTWSDEGRAGTYYYERGGEPRGQTVVYDRGDTPVKRVTAADLAVDRVREADAFLTTGITPALSDRLVETTGGLLAAASDADTRTVFDVNYRSKLWTPGEARETLRSLFGDVDVLFVAERDARRVLDCEGSVQSIARSLAERHDFETVVVTRGEEGALAVHDGTVHEQAAFATETHDPLGTGDALVGGYLATRLDGESVPRSLEYGAATAALKRTIEGDLAVVSPSEIESVLATAEGGDDIDR